MKNRFLAAMFTSLALALSTIAIANAAEPPSDLKATCEEMRQYRNGDRFAVLRSRQHGVTRALALKLARVQLNKRESTISKYRTSVTHECWDYGASIPKAIAKWPADTVRAAWAAAMAAFANTP